MAAIRFSLVAVLALTVTIPSALAQPAPDPPPQPVSTIPIERVVVADGLKYPWSVAFLPGGDFLVTEKDGGLKRINADGGVRALAGLPDDLDNVRQDPRDNSGLFDIVLDPKFADNGLLYFSYASKGPGGTALKLVRARLAGDRLGDVQPLLLAGPRSSDRFHYGGGLAIGPDGKLYLTAGERHYRESDNPPLPVAQDMADPRGKIHRLNLDGTIPADNPLIDGKVTGIFASGIRAAQGIAVEPVSGRIWFSEHGSLRGDEINVLERGANYGWPNRTSGTYRDATFKPPRLLDRSFTEPVFGWPDRTVAPTGITFYSGHAFPEWHGDLLVAGLRRGYLLRLDVENGSPKSAEYLLEDAPVRLRKVAQSPAGDLYILTDEANGKLIRLDRGKPGAR